MNLVNCQDILQSFDDLNLYGKEENVQHFEEWLRENDDQLNNEFHGQVSYEYVEQLVLYLKAIYQIYFP